MIDVSSESERPMQFYSNLWSYYVPASRFDKMFVVFYSERTRASFAKVVAEATVDNAIKKTICMMLITGSINNPVTLVTPTTSTQYLDTIIENACSKKEQFRQIMQASPINWKDDTLLREMMGGCRVIRTNIFVDPVKDARNVFETERNRFDKEQTGLLIRTEENRNTFACMMMMADLDHPCPDIIMCTNGKWSLYELSKNSATIF
jgi:hypothetical protein